MFDVRRRVTPGLRFITLACCSVLLLLSACGGGGGGGSGGSGGTTTITETVLHSFGGTGDGTGPFYASLIQAADGNLYGTTYKGGANNAGTVFKITTSGTETVLHSFGGAGDGAYPTAGLIQAADGNLYGTTNSGGANNWGTVFKITTSGTETVLWSFGGGPTDGANPNGSLIQATDGNLYGTTQGGGSFSTGTVFKITTAGAETVLYQFGTNSATDAFYPNGNLVQATDGNLYGMAWYGGTNNNGAVFKITLAGAETVLWSFGGVGDGAYAYGGLVQASDGNLYGMTLAGGSKSAGTVFRITTAGAETVLHSFAGPTTDGAAPYGNLIQGTDGNLYGMTYGGGGTASVGIVFMITTSGTETVLHSFAGGTTDGGSPHGSLIQASDGFFYGMTGGGGANNLGTVFKIN